MYAYHDTGTYNTTGEEIKVRVRVATTDPLLQPDDVLPAVAKFIHLLQSDGQFT